MLSEILKLEIMIAMEQNECGQKYVDILSLGGFNAFFGDENNKSAVMTIINELLPKHRQVAHIDYMVTNRSATS